MYFIRNAQVILLSEFGREDKRRNGRHIQKPDIAEPGLLEPGANLLERECVPVLGVNQHIDSKEQREYRSGSFRISKEIRNYDGSAGRKRCVGLTNQCPAFCYTQAV